MRLNYSIHFEYIGQTAPSRILFKVLSNYEGTPQFRIYEDGGVAPAFANCNLLFGNEINPPAGLYRVEYKDDNGEKLLSKIRIYDFAASCWDNDNVDYDEQGFNGTISVTDSGISVQTTVRRALSGNPAFNRNTNRSVSIDGGTTFKTVTDPTGAGTAQWSNSEIAALGITNEVSAIHIRRDISGAYSGCTTVPSENLMLDSESFDPIVVEHTKNNCTANGADDGTINITVTGGSGNFTYLWNDGAVTQNRANLPPDVYSVTVHDVTTGLDEEENDIQITEPQPESFFEGTTLDIPMLNDLQFVVEPVIPDGINTFQTPDNTLLINQIYPRMKPTCYRQKVCKADDRIVQFNSDFPSHTIGLYDKDDELVKSFNAVLKQENLNQTSDYLVTIRNHTGNPGQSRVYFNVGELPIPLSVGDVFEILNSLDGFDGAYEILNIEEDASLGYAYLVINKEYTPVTPTSSATGRFITSTDDFNTYEVVLSFSDVAEGNYYLKIRAFGTSTEKTGWSEPISVKTSHKDTTLITYRCNDARAFNILWSTGYIGRIRIESQLFKRRPGGDRSTSRNSDYSLTKINAKKIRGFTFETYMLPPYLHEKLSVIFDCDFFNINGVEYQSNEGYDQPQYIDYFMLASSSINIEQVGWLDRYNTNDIGSVDEGGFLLTETGFLKL